MPATYKWTTDTTRALIYFRAQNEQSFAKNKQAPKRLWRQFIQEAGLTGKVEPQQAAKKWDNLKTRYRDLRNPKTGSGADGGEETAANWQYYQDMHAVLGGWPSIDPPLLVSSCTPQEEPLLMFVHGPSTSPCSTDGCASLQSTPAVNPGSPSGSSAAGSPAPSPPPRKKRRKTEPVLDFLKEECEREQRRHEESEAKMERFLTLFERMVDKL